MSKPVLGIIGGGQLCSMLTIAAKKENIKIIVFSDDKDAPAQKFCDQFINAVDIITFEFENIPYETLKKINNVKPVVPHPSTNKIVQNRLSEKNFVNKLDIKTTKYVSIKKKIGNIIKPRFITGNFKNIYTWLRW